MPIDYGRLLGGDLLGRLGIEQSFAQGSQIGLQAAALKEQQSARRAASLERGLSSIGGGLAAIGEKRKREKVATEVASYFDPDLPDVELSTLSPEAQAEILRISGPIFAELKYGDKIAAQRLEQEKGRARALGEIETEQAVVRQEKLGGVQMRQSAEAQRRTFEQAVNAGIEAGLSYDDVQSNALRVAYGIEAPGDDAAMTLRKINAVRRMVDHWAVELGWDEQKRNEVLEQTAGIMLNLKDKDTVRDANKAARFAMMEFFIRQFPAATRDQARKAVMEYVETGDESALEGLSGVKTMAEATEERLIGAEARRSREGQFRADMAVWKATLQSAQFEQSLRKEDRDTLNMAFDNVMQLVDRYADQMYTSPDVRSALRAPVEQILNILDREEYRALPRVLDMITGFQSLTSQQPGEQPGKPTLPKPPEAPNLIEPEEPKPGKAELAPGAKAAGVAATPEPAPAEEVAMAPGDLAPESPAKPVFQLVSVQKKLAALDAAKQKNPRVEDPGTVIEMEQVAFRAVREWPIIRNREFLTDRIAMQMIFDLGKYSRSGAWRGLYHATYKEDAKYNPGRFRAMITGAAAARRIYDDALSMLLRETQIFAPTPDMPTEAGQRRTREARLSAVADTIATLAIDIDSYFRIHKDTLIGDGVKNDENPALQMFKVGVARAAFAGETLARVFNQIVTENGMEPIPDLDEQVRRRIDEDERAWYRQFQRDEIGPLGIRAERRYHLIDRMQRESVKFFPESTDAE